MVIFALTDFRRKISKSNIKVMINFEINYIIKTVRIRRKLYNLYVLNIFHTVTNCIIIDIKRYMYVCICMGAHKGGDAGRPKREGVGVWASAVGEQEGMDVLKQFRSRIVRRGEAQKMALIIRKKITHIEKK